jgi:hypothetical protein
MLYRLFLGIGLIIQGNRPADRHCIGHLFDHPQGNRYNGPGSLQDAIGWATLDIASTVLAVLPVSP